MQNFQMGDDFNDENYAYFYFLYSQTGQNIKSIFFIFIVKTKLIPPQYQLMMRALLMIFCCITPILSQSTCSAHCDIYFSNGAYQLGCTSSSPDDCTACNQELYTLVNSSCLLKSGTIYNSSEDLDFVGWEESQPSYIVSFTYSSDTYYLAFKYKPVLSYNYTLPSNAYGFRCRFWAYSRSASYAMNFTINYTYQYTLVRPVFTSYSKDTWIQTTPFVSFPGSSIVHFAFTRIDNSNNNYDVGVRELIIILAKCVSGCVTCTSLSDCSQCSGLTYLNNLTHLCVDDCPDGMFISPTVPNFCDWCEEGCLICSPNLADNSSICSMCADEGEYQSFLYEGQCYQICPNGYHPDYSTHTCQCPAGNYDDGMTCNPCSSACQQCSTIQICTQCNEGYYLQNSTNTCARQCPAGQYQPLNRVRQCYMCTVPCGSCENSSDVCTSCTTGYLYDHQCTAVCPDGYSGVGFVCEKCYTGTFSYKGSCVQECPEHYVGDSNMRACTLGDGLGYPITVSLSVVSAESFAISMQFGLQIDPDNRTAIASNVDGTISVTLVNTITSRLLSTTTITIDSVSVTASTISLTVSGVGASQLLPSHSLIVTFMDNVYATDGTMYTLTSTYPFSSNPSIISQYYTYSYPLFNIISIPLMSIALLMVILRVKYGLQIWVQYLECLQLLGLCVYLLFPTLGNQSLYAFVLGLSYSNFSFVYNAFRQLIAPCSTCSSLSGWVLVDGDMNYFRTAGSTLQVAFILIIISIILMNIGCTNNYGKYFLQLTIVLTFPKLFHSFVAALINISVNQHQMMMYGGVVVAATLILLFMSYYQYQWKQQYGAYNIHRIMLMVYVVLIVVMEYAVLLVGLLLITVATLEWILGHLYKVDDRGIVGVEMDDTCQHIYHIELFRVLRPITTLLIVCIVSIQESITTISLVTCIMGVLMILLMIDTVRLCQSSKPKLKPYQPEQQNETIQNIECVFANVQSQKVPTEKGQKQINLDDDDERVERKFRYMRRKGRK